MDRRFALIVGRMRPKGCICLWTSGHDYWGGDVLPTLTLTKVDKKCPIHKWLESQPYPVVKDS